MGRLLYNDRIEFNPDILDGKAIIKDTRISVEFLLELLVNDWLYKSILVNYPQLKREDILAAIDYAQVILKEEIFHPIKV